MERGNSVEKRVKSKITTKLIKEVLGTVEEIQDTEVKGFKLKFGKRNNTYVLRKKHNNKDIELVLGHYPEMSPDEARKVAIQKIASIEYYGRPDISPKKIPTIKDTLELQFSKIKFNYTNNTVLEKFRYMWDMPINSICKADIENFLETYKDTPQMANYSVRMFSAGFNRMCNEIEQDWRNPCKGVKMFPTKPRTRFLTPNEAPKLLEALKVLRKQKRNSVQADCLFLMIYTGQRKTNVLQLNKKDIQDNVWTVQAEEQKTQRDIIVPLNEFAIEIVNRYINLHKDGYLFKRNGRVMKDIPGTFKRACRMAGVNDCTIHDLRRSLGSWMLNNGVPIAVVSKTLGHSSIRVTEQVYAHLLGSTVSNATNQAVNSMFKGEFEK